jgi:hypothetical protein
MSLLGRYLAWFREQDRLTQIASSTALFVVLFVLGLYTAGIVPGLLAAGILIDHWYRG